ncbi:alcohol dehydrogenase catalytic domain-containing protein [Sphingomonas jatrophae]|uniref:S-(Hydroxymethyl)glutathione dehydrogenase / alcohol dehydrogenase n=1 Tax=Sphingomonas jatrophae TaxID=1166337 RepID=A0A1I6KKF4_9SPHN|nr:alcohol dehydrogenase catalytic domain-containing protein [Sphingomonas jatrophae]SFR91681.1 S-(hydroxymethyl)glutathione dehydrogenase / alcohol dehydrogenase [Sphingomonas jatrophae]
MRGIVFDGGRLQLTDALTVRDPGPGEVKVRVLRSGICHSDLNMVDSGMIRTPIVLGHEAAGEVMALGPGVTDFAVGDRVMVGTQTPCGECRECARGAPANCDVTWGMVAPQPFEWDGRPTYSFSNVSSFAGEIVAKTGQLFRTGDLPPEQAALIGCAVSTGYAAARTLGQVGAGDRVVVIGVGGIGVNAIAGAALAGAEVLAVDLNLAKEQAARDAGATDFLLATRAMDAEGLATALRDAFDPIDVAIECSGAGVAAEASILATKRGGRVVLIGQSGAGARASFDLNGLTMGKEIVARLNGGARPAEDYPTLIALAQDRRIDLGRQVTQVWPLAEFEAAIAALHSGAVTRAVLDHTA